MANAQAVLRPCSGKITSGTLTLATKLTAAPIVTAISEDNSRRSPVAMIDILLLLRAAERPVTAGGCALPMVAGYA
jgi:hypothetical protein